VGQPGAVAAAPAPVSDDASDAVKEEDISKLDMNLDGEETKSTITDDDDTPKNIWNYDDDDTPAFLRRRKKDEE
jgi:hypothetical protein